MTGYACLWISGKRDGKFAVFSCFQLNPRPNIISKSRSGSYISFQDNQNEDNEEQNGEHLAESTNQPLLSQEIVRTCPANPKCPLSSARKEMPKPCKIRFIALSISSDKLLTVRVTRDITIKRVTSPSLLRSFPSLPIPPPAVNRSGVNYSRCWTRSYLQSLLDQGLITVAVGPGEIPRVKQWPLE
ncbi:hypothetical protein RRG08_057869 [Elysia crispata]|uniref:Uncharacterized protein n=1 Tax=Elysia crispata TaxID=231223 RepID=A0AAE1E8G3_9GAST|nr:hypothetical protein RRG08_057869 [Elysia crispata]